jgi:hypothetical protein
MLAVVSIFLMLQGAIAEPKTSIEESPNELNGESESLITQTTSDLEIETQDIDISEEIWDQSSLDSQTMDQLSNVSQLRDVAPTDWAYEALRTLVERYGCIVGYPDLTYRGSRALSRSEFAAGLNACLNSMERILQEKNKVLEEDIAALRRLSQEFEQELTLLKTKVDNLEGRLAFLEDHQFSTTTKLFGSLRVQTNAYFSGEGDPDPQASMQYNMFLGHITSFTGRDSLITGFGITNTKFASLAPTNNGIDFGPTREGASDATDSGDTDNDVRLITLEYHFPIGDKVRMDIIAGNRYRFSPTLLSQFVPYYQLGQGPASSFAEAPPIYLVGGGSGLAVNYEFLESTVLTLTYISTFSNEPDQGKGLFNGDYIAAAQINYNPSPKLFLQALYLNGYFNNGNFAFNNGQTFRDNGFVGTALANRFDDAGVFFDDGSKVVTNAYQLGGYFAITPKFFIGGWANLIKARMVGKGDADIWTYSVQAAFPDLFREGNLGGLVVGMEPTLTGLRKGGDYVGGFENDTSLHLEAYYRHKINDNISITPSIIWITAPNQDADNEDIIVGGIRTTFAF